MTEKEKELYVGRKVTFFYRDKRFTIEGVINDIQPFGMLVKVTESRYNDFYVIGEEYLIPFSGCNFVYKFLS